MGNSDFTENLISEFTKHRNAIEIRKYWNKEKSLIIDYPFKGINIEIKPNNTGAFVIQLINFKFFDYSLLENYWKNILKHDDAKFILTSQCIYIYPKNLENIKQCVDILTYTVMVIGDTIDRIKGVLS